MRKTYILSSWRHASSMQGFCKRPLYLIVAMAKLIKTSAIGFAAWNRHFLMRAAGHDLKMLCVVGARSYLLRCCGLIDGWFQICCCVCGCRRYPTTCAAQQKDVWLWCLETCTDQVRSDWWLRYQWLDNSWHTHDWRTVWWMLCKMWTPVDSLSALETREVVYELAYQYQLLSRF